MNQQPYPTSWQSHTFRAMGSQIVLWLDTTDRSNTASAFAEVRALFARNESALSRFSPHSELMQLNGRTKQWVPVSALLWREVTLALQMAAQTNGRFDPTLLHALTYAGYDRSFEAVTGGVRNGRWLEPEQLYGRWQEVELDERRRAVRLPAGVGLDLGGIAKGDTAQQALRLLQSVGPALVDAGGDLVAGSAPAGCPGWPVGLSAPGSETAAANDLATFWLAEGALATSGVDFRSWVQDGVVAHHLIDPHTGQPAQTDVLTTTVSAPEAAVAEAWATAALVVGAERGINLLLDHDLAGLVIVRDGRILATPAMDHLLQGTQSFIEKTTNYANLRRLRTGFSF
ncbi:MAG: FAD:protein FMN transferase [Anaerolineaceae bacterium]|nr:FAD:protein FMN transferase [Anaerolineaceae bacterium]